MINDVELIIFKQEMATDAYKESVAGMNPSYHLNSAGKPTDAAEGYAMETGDYGDNPNYGNATGGYNEGNFQGNSEYYGGEGEFEDYGEEDYYGEEGKYAAYGGEKMKEDMTGAVGSEKMYTQQDSANVPSHSGNTQGSAGAEAGFNMESNSKYDNSKYDNSKYDETGGYRDYSEAYNEKGEEYGDPDWTGEDQYGEEGNEEEEEGQEEEDEDESEGEEESEEDDVEESDDEALNSLGDIESFLEDELGGEQEKGGDMDMPSSSGTQAEDPAQPEPENAPDGQKKKRKRRKKKESGADGEKPKRKRKKKGEETEDGEKKKADKHARKNIRKILSENKLEQETLDAQAAELERQRRLQELKKQQMGLLQMTAEREAKKDKDSQLKSLLQTAEEDAEKQESVVKKEDTKDDVKETPKKKEGIIDISSGEEDEDCVMVQSEEEEEEEEDLSDEEYAEAEDMNNSGSHINDEFNVPDAQGRVLVNVGHPTSDQDIFLSTLVASYIKPHQIGGVRFLYDNLVECINRFKTSSGFGCILAHSMGLGKTIQMIGFTDIFLRYTGARTVMVIVPINTLANWMSEFNMWVPDEKTCKEQNYPEDMKPRPYHVYILNDLYKTTPARAKVIDEWYKTGGVLLIGYEMYRLLSSKKVHLQKTPKRRKAANSSEVIDVEEEDRDKKLLIVMHDALVSPGPDLVVCDEGHRIKNSHAGISQSLKQIKTKRRIVLTGYPLQNNLIEYWCMVDFVRPNFLGTKTEFCNMFERPIMNGQCADSTPQDVRLMRYRAHVLHSLLEGFVQRRGHTVLQAALPPKQEYVFMIRPSPIQKELYTKFMESISESGQNGWVNNNPLKAFSVCCKIWNHPDILYTCMKKSLDDNDLDIETGEPKKRGRGKPKKETPPATPVPPTLPTDSGSQTPSMSTPSTTPTSTPMPTPPPTPGQPGQPSQLSGQIPSHIQGQGPPSLLSRLSEPSIVYDWANEILKDYTPGVLQNGGKMVMLFRVIEQALAAGDKILVFSQSLFTLNLIEEFLGKQKVPRYELDEYWCKNKNYFRLDGSTASSEREKLINTFNYDPSKWVFLLSTRAGSLGVNLVGANRVIVMDASWNPCHDCQAICRVYRFGQMKPSFIYRFVTENTMERKIYDRQVNKQGMSDRVVDELNPQNQFRKEQVDKLLNHETKDYDILDFSECEKEYTDPVMLTLLKSDGYWMTGKPFTHESLLIDRKELKLTMKEKRLAKQSYVMEKRLNVSYSRPSYAAYYPRGRGGARPIASVKPMVSTPVPMRPKIVAAPQVLKPGVSVHQVLTTTEICLPGTTTTTDSGTTEPKKIPAGQQVLVIRTPKGVYIRTPDGKIFAVRSKPQPNSTSPLDTLANTGSNLTVSTAAGSRAVTIVRPNLAATTTTSSVSVKTPTGVTVIRPTTANSSTKPLTIIRQGPGPVRTIIPVTLGSKMSTTTTKSLVSTGLTTTITQAQTINSAIQSGAQVRIVTSDGKTSVNSLAALQNLSEGKKIISNSPAFSGGSLILKPAQSDTQTGKNTILATPTISSASGNGEQENNVPSSMDTSEKQESNNDLKPIDLKALKLPQQLSASETSEGKRQNANTTYVQSTSAKPSMTSKPLVTESRSSKSKRGKAASAKASSESSRPTFSLSHSPSSYAMSEPSDSQSPKLGLQSNIQPQNPFSSSLSTRPSDIDLHEMQLSGPRGTNQNSIQQQVVPSSFVPVSSRMSTGVQQSANMQPNQRDSPNTGSMMDSMSNSISNNASSMNNMRTSMSMSNMQQPQANIAPQQTNKGIFNPGLPSTSLKPTMSDPGHMNSQNQIGNNMQTGHMGNTNFTGSGFMGMLENNSGYGAPVQPSVPIQSSATGSSQNHNTDFLSEFNSIQNNSSFLSELNFTEADDSFLSQLGDSSNQSSQSSAMSAQGGQVNHPSAMNNFGNSNMSNFQNSNMGMQGFQQQQPNFNFDMFSNSQQQQQQQNSGFFPNFNSNQFSGNSGNYGNSQNMNMSQGGGFPGNSMYPMGGMMQPGMYGYPAFPAYPYPPMMAPMPYYPMPFQPQYGGQGASMGPQGTNMGSQGSNMGSQGGSIGAQGGGGIGMNQQQGDNSFQSGSGNSS